MDAELKQIQSYYQESHDFLYPRKLRQVKQLILFNNLQRGDENIASTLLFTLFNRTLSNNYDDKMQVKFIPSEEIEQRNVNSLNLLAQNDYREMEKAKLDYDWMWDTLAFSKGYCETIRFDTKRKIMKPQIINPLHFGYDPYFSEVQQWRYYWKWMLKSKWDIQKLIKKGFITGIQDVSEIQPGVDPYLWDFKIRRDQAKQANAVPSSSTQSDVYQILEFYGHDEITGKKTVWWIDQSFGKVLMKQELDLKDGEDGESKWAIVEKVAFREPHSSTSVSILDLLEDKHRAKSVLLNLAYIAAKDEANPIYGYNPDKVRDVTQFFSRQINQHIPMDDQNAVFPLNQKPALSQSLISFISLLTQEANDPVGTGMSMQPIKKGKQTATEAAMQQQLNDLAQSLQSKIMQQGEKEFWSHWYHRYKRYTSAGDYKLATIIGVKGMTFEKIDLGDIQTTFPPGVHVYSAKEAEYKELVLRRDLMQMYPAFQETLGQDGMRNFNKHIFFPKFFDDPTLIDVVLPDSHEEKRAYDENDQLSNDVLPDVKESDDHSQHLYIHYMAKKTPATWSHILWHEELLSIKKQQEEKLKVAASQMKEGGSDSSMGGGQPSQSGGKMEKPKVKAKKQSPLEASVPLKEDMQPLVGKR